MSVRELLSRLRARRAERRRTAGERAIKRKAAADQRLRHERFQDKGGPGPMGGPGI